MDAVGLVMQQAALNNAWSAEQAQKQMDFQREMSNTAHVREVADLKAAGLNPILSAHTNGASTPSGAMGTVDTSITSALIEALKEFGQGLGSGITGNDGSAVHNLKSIQDMMSQKDSSGNSVYRSMDIGRSQSTAKDLVLTSKYNNEFGRRASVDDLKQPVILPKFIQDVIGKAAYAYTYAKTGNNIAATAASASAKEVAKSNWNSKNAKQVERAIGNKKSMESIDWNGVF